MRIDPVKTKKVLRVSLVEARHLTAADPEWQTVELKRMGHVSHLEESGQQRQVPVFHQDPIKIELVQDSTTCVGKIEGPSWEQRLKVVLLAEARVQRVAVRLIPVHTGGRGR